MVTLHKTSSSKAINFFKVEITHFTAESLSNSKRCVNFPSPQGFGLSHVRSERAAEIVKVVPINTFQRDTEGFIFPEGKTVATFTSWKRKTSGDPRDLRLISLTELGNSMVDLCRRTHGLQQEELLRQTGLAFGHKTLSSVVRARTEKALAFALSRKLLVLNGDHYEPNES
jgi:hypothetical protein